MSGFPILDLVIGMIFIYFLLSIICSSAVELWLSLRRVRARVLERWLEGIFQENALKADGSPLGKTVGQAIMDHCMVTVLSGTKKSPEYIDSQNFVSALLDQITRGNPPAGSTISLPPSDLPGYIQAIKNSTALSGELKRTLLIYANEAQQAAAAINTIPKVANVVNNFTASIKSEVELFREKLERWYDTNGDRLTASFKRRKVIPLTILMAVLITVGLNADSLMIGRYLYDHKEVSKQFADKASNSFENYKQRIDTIKNHAPDTTPVTIEKLNSNLALVRQDIDTLYTAIPADLPIGWKDGKMELKKFPSHILGWLATILAICLGAPFWFDILNKVANLRGSGAKPATTTGQDDKKT
jgi:hypothetical protein